MKSLHKELRKELANNRYEVTDTGEVLFPSTKILMRGEFAHDVNGEDEIVTPNMIVNEGLDYILDVALSAGTYLGPFYISVFKANVSPTSSWTAANYVATATEAVHTTDVTPATNRPEWTEAGVSSQVIDNYASKAAITVVPATLDLWGAALLTSQPWASTSGKLIAATNFGTARSLLQNDVFNIGYRFTASDA